MPALHPGERLPELLAPIPEPDGPLWNGLPLAPAASGEELPHAPPEVGQRLTAELPVQVGEQPVAAVR
eukprot:12342111-Alexandrium_andersonii.AAC.1